MDPLFAEQIRDTLMRLPDLAADIDVSVVLESISYGEVPAFDHLTTDGWRVRHDGEQDLFALGVSFVPTLTANSRARLIIVCDRRTGRQVPERLVIVGVKHLLQSQEFDAIMSIAPERLVIVTIEEGVVSLVEDRGKEMISIIQRARVRGEAVTKLPAPPKKEPIL